MYKLLTTLGVGSGGRGALEEEAPTNPKRSKSEAPVNSSQSSSQALIAGTCMLGPRAECRHEMPTSSPTTISKRALMSPNKRQSAGLRPFRWAFALAFVLPLVVAGLLPLVFRLFKSHDSRRSRPLAFAERSLLPMSYIDSLPFNQDLRLLEPAVPEDHQIPDTTAVILNWSRFPNVRRIVRELCLEDMFYQVCRAKVSILICCLLSTPGACRLLYGTTVRSNFTATYVLHRLFCMRYDRLYFRTSAQICRVRR
jgi:hypothetical protein